MTSSAARRFDRRRFSDDSAKWVPSQLSRCVSESLNIPLDSLALAFVPPLCHGSILVRFGRLPRSRFARTLLAGRLRVAKTEGSPTRVNALLEHCEDERVSTRQFVDDTLALTAR